MADRAHHRHPFRHTWRGRAFSAFTLACFLIAAQCHLGIFVELYSELLAVAPFRHEVDSPAALVLIEPGEYDTIFGHTSPLDRGQLARFFRRLNERYVPAPEAPAEAGLFKANSPDAELPVAEIPGKMLPKAIGIDLQLAPVSDQDDRSQGRKDLELELCRLAGKGSSAGTRRIPVVLVEPDPRNSDAARAGDWRERMLNCGVTFASSTVAISTARFDPTSDSLGVTLARRAGKPQPPSGHGPPTGTGEANHDEPDHGKVDHGKVDHGKVDHDKGCHSHYVPLPTTERPYTFEFSYVQSNVGALDDLVVVIGGAYERTDTRFLPGLDTAVPSATIHAMVAQSHFEFKALDESAVIAFDVVLGLILAGLYTLIWNGLHKQPALFANFCGWYLLFWVVTISPSLLLLYLAHSLAHWGIDSATTTLFALGISIHSFLSAHEAQTPSSFRSHRMVDRVLAMGWALVQWVIIGRAVYILSGNNSALGLVVMLMAAAFCYVFPGGPLTTALRTLRRRLDRAVRIVVKDRQRA